MRLQWTFTAPSLTPPIVRRHVRAGRLAVVALTCLMSAAPDRLAAQLATPTLIGERVRVLAPPAEWRVGRVVALDSNALVLRSCWGAEVNDCTAQGQDTRAIPLSAVRGLEVSLGRPRRGPLIVGGAVLGGLLGAVVGAAVGARATQCPNGCEDPGIGALPGILIGGLAGVAIGGAVGNASVRERWRPVLRW
jgi:hypothetical protein